MALLRRTILLTLIVLTGLAACGGGGGSDSAPSNSAPVAQPVAAATNEDEPVTGTLIATDSDGDPLSYQLVDTSSGNHKGVLEITNSTAGDFRYTPNMGEYGDDVFTYSANDGKSNSNNGTVTVSINARPRVSDLAVETVADESVSQSIDVNDADLGALTVSIDGAPSNGTVLITDARTGDFTYDPNPGFVGADSFTVLASDGLAQSSPATVTIDISERPIIGFAEPSSFGNEGQVEDISVVLDVASPIDSEVFILSDSTATPAIDFELPVSVSPLLIPAGQTSVDVSLNVLLDVQAEVGENVALTLVNPCGGCDIAVGNEVHTVMLDDWRGMRQFSNDSPSGGLTLRGESLADDSSSGPIFGGTAGGQYDGVSFSGGGSVTQFDLTGEIIWISEIKPLGAQNAKVLDVQRGSDGSLYATGTVYYGSGFTDVFVSRLGSNGTIEWIQTFGTSFEDVAYSVAVDSMGAVYVAGRTSGDLAGPSFGGIDFFIARYLADGTLDWIRQTGTIESDALNYVPLTVTGNDTIVVGANMPSVDADIIGFDSSGTELWRVAISDGVDLSPRELNAVSSDSFVATGAIAAGLVPGQNSGPFVAKFDSLGSRIWVSQVLDDQTDQPGVYDSAISPDGSIWVTGSTFGDLVGDGNEGVTDLFVLRFDPNDELLWVQEAGSTLSDHGLGIGIDGSGDAYVLVNTSGSFLEYVADPNSPNYHGIFKISKDGSIH